MDKQQNNTAPKISPLERFSLKITDWIGTPQSILVHTLLFILIFALKLFGVTIDSILLILTTAVSLEAIYLAIFIQMTVNRNTKSLAVVEEDIDEIQEDIDEIQEDVEELEEDVDEMQEDEKQDNKEDIKTKAALTQIESDLQKLLKDIESLKDRNILRSGTSSINEQNN